MTARAVGVAPRLAAVRRDRPAPALHSACDCAVPVAAPCALSFGLCSEPLHCLRVSGPGHTSPRPGPWRLAPAESGRRAGGACGAAGVSAGSPGARLCARAGRGRAVTRRARRIPDSRPALRPPRTSAHCLPGSGRCRRTVSTRVGSPAAPAPCPYSFFRLVLIWVLVTVAFIIIPKDSIVSLLPLPATHLIVLSKLTPQASEAGEGFLSRSRCCALSLRTALCPGFPL